jgi:hypothetical protein
MSLGWPGRLAVAIAVVAGLILGAQTGIGLPWFIPFGGVGALLAVRRPRTSIGWILLALGFAFAFSPASVDATAEQFASMALPLPTALFALLVFAAPGVIFYLLAVMAVVFPSGRLPGGRWALPARVALGAGLLLVMAMVVPPNLILTLKGSPASVPVRNPFALLPDLPLWDVLTPDMAIFPLFLLLFVSVVSLVVRFRRARGIERQQLRWFGASLAFVILAVLVGLLIVASIPGSGEAGYAWFPAIGAFPTVPVAIGIAVLRYRLYEIDSIINRAIVYGLLTAILAGASSAAIGVGQRLFEGVIGPGSDATIVLTTLVVVTAFTPIKNRIQAIVDRRFKEVHDPVAELDAFVSEVRHSLGAPDRDRALRRLLEVAVVAYGAGGGEVRLSVDDASRLIATVTTSVEPGATVSAAADDIELTLSGVDASRDYAPLHGALAAVLAEVAGGATPDPRMAAGHLGDT